MWDWVNWKEIWPSKDPFCCTDTVANCITPEFFFWPCWKAHRFLVPQPGTEPVPSKVETRILTTGLPGKSPRVPDPTVVAVASQFQDICLNWWTPLLAIRTEASYIYFIIFLTWITLCENSFSIPSITIKTGYVYFLKYLLPIFSPHSPDLKSHLINNSLTPPWL